MILDTPRIYEFGDPIGGTYPPWYDPAYWYEGVTLRFDPQQQIRVLLSNALFYFDLVVRQQGVLLAGILILYLIGHRQQPQAKEMLRRWALLIPAVCAFILYGLVYVETRYLGPFVVLVCAELLAGLPQSNAFMGRRLMSVIGLIMLLFLLGTIAAANLEGIFDLTEHRGIRQQASVQDTRPTWPGEVAEKLHRLGIRQGDKVAVIGYAFDSFWARLARVKIVAEMVNSDKDPSWLDDGGLQSQVIQAFASTGAKAIVAENVPSHASLSNWHRVRNSNYYIFVLAQ
jgi:hypothetical protein